jgi:hypothetical protein
MITPLINFLHNLEGNRSLIVIGNPLIALVGEGRFAQSVPLDGPVVEVLSNLRVCSQLITLFGKKNVFLSHHNSTRTSL